MSGSHMEFWTDFFNLWHENPSTWDRGSSEYLNSEIRHQGMATLLKKFKELYGKANLDDLKKKLAGFRSTVGRENRLVMQSES